MQERIDQLKNHAKKNSFPFTNRRIKKSEMILGHAEVHAITTIEHPNVFQRELFSFWNNIV